MNVRIDEAVVDVPAGAPCADALKAALSGKKFKSVVACQVGDVQLDLSAPLPDGPAELPPIYGASPEGVALVRHSPAPVMAPPVPHPLPSAPVTFRPPP